MISLIGDQIVVEVINKNKSPNEEIVKAAIASDLTDDQIKRLIEYVNVKLFNELFKQGITDFEVADPKIIFKELKKGMEKKASFQEVIMSYGISVNDNPMFNSQPEQSGPGLTVSKFPKWMTEQPEFVKTSSEEFNEINKLAAQAKIQKILSGKDYKIPTISKIASVLDEKQLLNLEFKKYAGCEESDELAEELLSLVRG